MPRIPYDEFEVIEQIGNGTVGTVYRARMKSTDQIVALKVLLPAATHDKQISARFAREMVILERLNHPNIVKYHGGGEYNGQLFYAMELVEGGSLRDVLTRNGSMTWDESVECGWQVCSALQHAHNHGVIHRDLKPANLFLSKDGVVKLGDFGIALDLRTTSNITATGLTVGSYMYMSPEQIRGEPVTNQTDLYALGCLLFEMLMGRPPFPGQNFAHIFDQHLHTPAPPVNALSEVCPEPMESIIKQLLEKDPNSRPFNARSVQGMLAEVKIQFDEQADWKRRDSGQAAGSTVLSNLLLAERAVQDAEEASWTQVIGTFVAVTIVAALAWYWQKGN
ncbi:MAG: serine/threonine protein kinase [Planctomycetaceae bacterium]|nr:serine/threonine protein kinase [Planctomycetaceae bacterium]